MKTHLDYKREALQAALSAETVWAMELRRAFGPLAGTARYTKQGEGEPGSQLRAAYVHYHKCREYWEAACRAYDESQAVARYVSEGLGE
jgi:hypothetical protein